MQNLGAILKKKKGTSATFKKKEKKLNSGGTAFNLRTLGRQRQVELCTFNVNLVYKGSSRRSSKATLRIPVLTNQKGKKRDQHIVLQNPTTNNNNNLENIIFI